MGLGFALIGPLLLAVVWAQVTDSLGEVLAAILLASSLLAVVGCCFKGELSDGAEAEEDARTLGAAVTLLGGPGGFLEEEGVTNTSGEETSSPAACGVCAGEEDLARGRTCSLCSAIAHVHCTRLGDPCPDLCQGSLGPAERLKGPGMSLGLTRGFAIGAGLILLFVVGIIAAVAFVAPHQWEAAADGAQPFVIGAVLFGPGLTWLVGLGRIAGWCEGLNRWLSG